MTEFVGVLAGRIACPREVARVIGETMIEQPEASERGDQEVPELTTFIPAICDSCQRFGQGR